MRKFYCFSTKLILLLISSSRYVILNHSFFIPVSKLIYFYNNIELYEIQIVNVNGFQLGQQIPLVANYRLL